MADNNKVPQDEESNIDQINKFVTNSDSENFDEEKTTDKPIGVVEEKRTDEDDNDEPKKEEQPKPIIAPNQKKNLQHNNKKVNEHAEKKTSIHEDKKLNGKKPSTVKNHEHKSEIKVAPAPVRSQIKDKKPVRHNNHDNKKMAKQNNEKRRNKNTTKNTFLWIGIGVLVAVLVIALIMLVWPNNNNPANDNETTNAVAATVNGDPIYLQDIMTQYQNLNPVLQQLYTVDTLLNKSIDDMLLYQESKRLEINIPDNQVEQELDAVAMQNQMTKAQLEEALEAQGMTLKEAKEVIQKSLAIREMLNRTILSEIEISENEIQNYYTLNADKYRVPDQVTIRHILIIVNETVDNETAKEKIEDIENMLNRTNFCELAKEYSDDPGSKDKCGEYTFGKGDFNNPEFENPSFDLDVGKHSIITTMFGYHLIQKIADIPAHAQNLTEVNDDIESTLYDAEAQKSFDALLVKLRSEAVIVNYYNKDSNNSTTQPVEDNLDAFAKCLTEKNATMYGAYWCTHCQSQKEMFGDSLEYINYVECAVEGQPQVQTKACTDAKIGGYPTWVINGEQYPGEQTLARLESLTGCKR